MRNQRAHSPEFLWPVWHTLGQSGKGKWSSNDQAENARKRHQRSQACRLLRWTIICCTISWITLATGQSQLQAAWTSERSSSKVAADNHSPESEQSWKSASTNCEVRTSSSNCTEWLADPCTNSPRATACKACRSLEISDRCPCRVAWTQTRADAALHVRSADTSPASHGLHDCTAGSSCNGNFKFGRFDAAELNKHCRHCHPDGCRTAAVSWPSRFCLAESIRSELCTAFHADTRRICTESFCCCIISEPSCTYSRVATGRSRSSCTVDVPVHRSPCRSRFATRFHAEATNAASRQKHNQSAIHRCRFRAAARELGYQCATAFSQSIVQSSHEAGPASERGPTNTHALAVQSHTSPSKCAGCSSCEHCHSRIARTTHQATIARRSRDAIAIPTKDRSVHSSAESMPATVGTAEANDTSNTIETACHEPSCCLVSQQSSAVTCRRTTRSHLDCQYSRTRYRCRCMCLGTGSVVTKCSSMSQGCQSCPRCHPRAAKCEWLQHSGSQFPIIQIANSSPNGDCGIGMGRSWKPTISREVGIGSCMDCFGPTNPHAVASRTSTDCPVLHLDELLPMPFVDKSLAMTQELWETLRNPWPEHATFDTWDFLDLLPDLQPQFRSVLQDVPVWQGEPVNQVSIFVDGSSYSNRHEPNNAMAAWALAVVYECQVNGAPHRFRCASHHRLSEAIEDSESFLGIGEFCHDSLSSEAVSMAWALVWILQSGLNCQFEVFYDNCTIGQFVAGQAQWRCTWEYQPLKRVLSALRSALHVSGIDVKFSHVKSHTGSPWNELVDSVAKSSVKGILPELDLPCKVATALRNPRIGYLWMEVAQSSSPPKPVSMRATFNAEGPFPPVQEDVTWNRHVAQPVQENVRVTLTCGTINVLTLDPGAKAAQDRGLLQQGRIASLQGQLLEHSIHLVGLQECRTQKEQTRHSSTHLVFQSGATDKGTHGCELWVDVQHAYAHSGSKKYHFAKDHFHVAYASPRCLFIEVRASHLHICVLVCHAPHKATTDMDFHQWWADLSVIVHRTCVGIPLIVLADTNSQLGTICSDSVSNHQANIESATGHCFHGFLMEHNLWVPATFEECHSVMAIRFLPVRDLHAGWILSASLLPGSNLRCHLRYGMTWILPLLSMTISLRKSV